MARVDGQTRVWDQRRSPVAASCRLNDENPRAKFQNVRGDSSARRASVHLRNRGQVAIGLRCLGFGRQESLRRNEVCAALGKNLFDLGVRAGDDVY